MRLSLILRIQPWVTSSQDKFVQSLNDKYRTLNHLVNVISAAWKKMTLTNFFRSSNGTIHVICFAKLHHIKVSSPVSKSDGY